MAVSKFRFVSPGIQFQEIDNSRLPSVPEETGPVIVGRAERGPALIPVEIGSFSEFVEVFGNPHAGGQGGDVWRDGNFLAPIYGAYAAQAWLRNSSKITYVRLLGAEHEDRTNAGRAGWQVGDAHDGTLATGGAFGLFVVDSGSAGSFNTGSLAAIWYLEEGSIELSGANRDGLEVTGTAVLVESQGTDKEFKALVKDSTGATTDTISFNFNRSSKKYARSVFSTNPTLLNENVTRVPQRKKYFLGETFERSLADNVTSNAGGAQYGVILALQSGSVDQNDQKMPAAGASTGWIFSQDLGANTAYDYDDMVKLMKIHALNLDGEWTQKNLKISISDIKPSTNQDDLYGTFTVVVRKVEDNDNSLRVVESFTQCNLNPFSPNYVAKKIGDKTREWSDIDRRFREFGNHANNSKFIRVEMNEDVDAGATNPELLPFGVFGPVRFKGFAVTSGSADAQAIDASAAFPAAFAAGNANVVGSKGSAGLFVDSGASAFSASFVFPALPTRSTSQEGNLSNPREAYFGADSTRSTSTRLEESWKDVVRKLPESLEDDVDSNSSLEYSWTFSLDDLKPLGNSDAEWEAGSRLGGASFTAATGTYEAVIDAGFDRFTVPLVGGFDGVDITEKEPFVNREITGKTEKNSYEFNSVKRALDSAADPELVVAELLVAPGFTATNVTDHMLEIAETRRDMMAIIDLEGDFVPSAENILGDSSTTNRGSVDLATSNLRNRALNTSYGAAYFPWVQIRDTESGATLWSPPSLAALGAYSFSDRRADKWIAPAGFVRGGLTNGAAGIPVVGVRSRLDSKERDKLYEFNINPIGTFPSEGVVIFGQKTLQATPSALDRVNVRRLMNVIKRQISLTSTTILFDQNVAVTWNRFTSAASKILENIKGRLGLEDFRFILDESTTTADLKDRNILYAKVLLKPARAIEFIAIDFTITNSGASFED